MCRDLVAGPGHAALPRVAARPYARTPEGQKYLSGSIAALRTEHVVYLHNTHLGLTQVRSRLFLVEGSTLKVVDPWSTRRLPHLGQVRSRLFRVQVSRVLPLGL